MECKFCKQKDESQLTVCTRVIGGKVEHIDVCLDCWPVERAAWENKLENERRKTLSKQRNPSAGAIFDEERNQIISEV